MHEFILIGLLKKNMTKYCFFYILYIVQICKY